MSLTNQEALALESDPNLVVTDEKLPTSARHTPTLVTATDVATKTPLAPTDKSILIDQAYDDYCRLREAGASPDPDAFCERYPGLQNSLRRLLEAHQFLEDNPQLLAEEKPPAWPAVGDGFLGFELLRELGRGAFARVFLGEEPALGQRKVAVKIAFRGASEAETLGRLRHPNIVPVHSVRQDPRTGLTAVCMPFLGSATLTTLLDRVAEKQRVPSNAAILAEVVREAGLECDLARSAVSLVADLKSQSYNQTIAEMGAQIADALAFVHARGIFHRDLKPSNILLGADGIPRLLDFNLSFDEETAQQRLGGTLPYMAPEQLQACDGGKSAHPGFVGAAADIFSLGLLLYELLTGKHPFGPIPLKLTTPEVRDLLLERQQAGPRSLRLLNPRVGRQLATTIEQCLAFDPAERPESAAKVANALKRSQTFLGKSIPWARTHVKGLIAVGVLGVIGTITAAAALPKSEPVSRQKYEQGLAQLRTNDVHGALESFDGAIRAEPNCAEALFARGLAHQKSHDAGSLKAAVDDFRAAYHISEDPRIASCMLYCLGSMNDHDEAISWFSALPEESTSNIDLNNFSCCLVHRHKKGDMLTATILFRKALVTSPGFLAIVNNYQIADFRLAREEKRVTIPPKPINLTLELVEPSFDELK
jgi:eukaryotic-like serine/threonine-protein kinase